ncbi:hypothetical protein ACWEKT_06230 [Nocardia takedensis]|uniref:hypothetical protein n=1 Tax=Nocardia takedensis TaxID=259390 RepID=UPI0002F24AE0|nr:hypothetical protein [Nocardia takedensis]
MSWEDQHTRSEILRTVLARAAVDPARADLFTGLPELDRLFGGVTGLLAALRHRWNNHLAAKLDQAMTAGQTSIDAYLELCAEQPALRALLDAHRDRPVTAPATAR